MLYEIDEHFDCIFIESIHSIYIVLNIKYKLK